ncbi:MAG: hypothetical protein ACRDRB_24095 [Pseudonocardiaceae bacterium]
MATSLPITPTFVLPFKRFATPCLLQHAREYLERGSQTYRQTVRSDRAFIGYEAPAGAGKAAVGALHWATLWHLLTWLGSQTAALQTALVLLSQYDPTDDLHRFVGAVAPQKYRNPERQGILTTARRLLHVIDRWDRTFPERFFPRFATSGGVP